MTVFEKVYRDLNGKANSRQSDIGCTSLLADVKIGHEIFQICWLTIGQMIFTIINPRATQNSYSWANRQVCSLLQKMLFRTFSVRMENEKAHLHLHYPPLSTTKKSLEKKHVNFFFSFTGFGRFWHMLKVLKPDLKSKTRLRNDGVQSILGFLVSGGS